MRFRKSKFIDIENFNIISVNTEGERINYIIKNNLSKASRKMMLMKLRSI